jgi:hypothetical protein
MQIETYEIEESKDELALMACDSEALELIEKLGLEGQKSLSDKETVTRFPYRKMTKEESNVYGLLFPQRSLLEKYKDGIIPLRVLQVAAHCKELDFLENITVWYPENADITDPVLVGTRKDPEKSYITEVYILARWGSALESLEALAVKAKKMWIERAKSELINISSKVKADIEAIDSIQNSDAMPNLSGTFSYYPAF